MNIIVISKGARRVPVVLTCVIYVIFGAALYNFWCEQKFKMLGDFEFLINLGIFICWVPRI